MSERTRAPEDQTQNTCSSSVCVCVCVCVFVCVRAQSVVSEPCLPESGAAAEERPGAI